MATLNISLPDELKSRMDQVKGVKWSRVASEAFEIEVRIRTMDTENIENAIVRLKASQAKCSKTDFADGRNDGQSWAKEDAEWSELVKMSRIPEQSRNLDGLWTALKDAFDWEKEYEMLEQLFGMDSKPTEAYVAGFIEGALAIKSAVDDA
jgi:hypothetical protein